MSSVMSILIHEIVRDLDALKHALGIPVYIVH